MKQKLMVVFLIAVAASSGPESFAAPTEVVNWSSGVSYTYDGRGSVRQMGSDAVAYDHAGRVIRTEINGVVRVYEYDAYGNRQKCTQNPNTAAVSDCQPGLTINSNDNRIVQATYDPSGKGNVVALGGNSYSYDATDMMTRAVSSDGPREFLYTADGERLATYAVNSQSWRWTVRDVSGKVLREFTSRDGAAPGSASFQWARDNVWRKDLLLASLHPAGGAAVRYHYHLDHLGTPRRITDDRDNIVGFHDYFAFGPEVSGGLEEPSASPLKYTAQERDAVSDPNSTLDYTHARYYSPMLARFSTVDPLLDQRRAMVRPQAWNRYAYVLNDPINLHDPDGRQAENPNDKLPDAAVDQCVAEETARNVVMLVYGGFQLLTNQEESKVEQGRKRLTYSVTGMAVLLGSWALLQVIQDTVMNVPPGQPQDPANAEQPDATPPSAVPPSGSDGAPPPAPVPPNQENQPPDSLTPDQEMQHRLEPAPEPPPCPLGQTSCS